MCVSVKKCVLCASLKDSLIVEGKQVATDKSAIINPVSSEAFILRHAHTLLVFAFGHVSVWCVITGMTAADGSVICQN